MPKFDPTIPVQVQFWSAAFVHLAVAAAPTFRHVIDADAGEIAKTARAMLERISMFAAELELQMMFGRKQQLSPYIFSPYLTTYPEDLASALSPV